MNKIVINAMAKINLGLDVLRRRENGYHDVKMIMQTLELCDIITAEKTENVSAVTQKIVKIRSHTDCFFFIIKSPPSHFILRKAVIYILYIGVYFFPLAAIRSF